MKPQINEIVISTIKQFKLPRYEDIPDVGLYLEQTASYMNQYFKVIPDMEITTSMISNYVKKGLVDRSIKKKYYRHQIAALMFITVAKNVLSIDRISQLFILQSNSYDLPIAYEYFRMELDNVIEFVFGLKEEIDHVGVTSSHEKEMLRYTITTFAHKIYLELYLQAIFESEK